MTDATTPEGFKEVPGNEYFLVNESGEVWSKKLQRLVKISTQKTGYLTVAQATKFGVRTYYVHRLVGLAFIEIPEHVKEATSKPEINHKDGDKSNNKKSNLEWVTPQRNIKHSIETGLTGHKAVEAKHVTSGHLMRFPTATDCAKHFGIPWRRLVRHLSSSKAGKLTKNWYVFRYEDNCDWPHIPEDRKMENRWDQPNGMYFVKHIESGVTGFSETMHKLAETTGIPYNTIQSVLRSDGREYKIAGHLFWFDEYPVAVLMSGSNYRKEHKFRKTKCLKIKHSKTGKVQRFESLRSLAKFMQVPPGTLEYNIRNWGQYKEYLIKFEEE